MGPVVAPTHNPNVGTNFQNYLPRQNYQPHQFHQK